MPPNSLKKTASVKNWVRISRRVAPMALRMPISLIRSETETSIIFIIPIPATTNAITLTEKANNLIPSENGFNSFNISSLDVSSKLLSSPGGTFLKVRKIPITSSRVWSYISSEGASTVISILRRQPPYICKCVVIGMAIILS